MDKSLRPARTAFQRFERAVLMILVVILSPILALFTFMFTYGDPAGAPETELGRIQRSYIDGQEDLDAWTARMSQQPRLAHRQLIDANFELVHEKAACDDYAWPHSLMSGINVSICNDGVVGHVWATAL